MRNQRHYHVSLTVIESLRPEESRESAGLPWEVRPSQNPTSSSPADIFDAPSVIHYHQRQQQQPEVSADTSATMAVPRKAKSRSIYRGGKKLQVSCASLTMEIKTRFMLTRVLEITPINTIHTAPQRTADTQRRAPKATVIIPFDVLNFPSLSGAAIVSVGTGTQVQCSLPTSKWLLC